MFSLSLDEIDSTMLDKAEIEGEIPSLEDGRHSITIVLVALPLSRFAFALRRPVLAKVLPLAFGQAKASSELASGAARWTMRDRERCLVQEQEFRSLLDAWSPPRR